MSKVAPILLLCAVPLLSLWEPDRPSHAPDAPEAAGRVEASGSLPTLARNPIDLALVDPARDGSGATIAEEEDPLGDDDSPDLDLLATIELGARPRHALRPVALRSLRRPTFTGRSLPLRC